MRRYLFQTLILLFATTVWIGCDKDHDDDCEPKDTTYKLSGDASGAKERPNPTETPATGTISGTYNKDDNMLHYTITWKDLTVAPSAMHFHGPATPDSAAGVQIGITGFPMTTTGMVSGMATLSDAQESQLLGGLWYYNIHTPTYPGGEIRGNITTTAE